MTPAGQDLRALREKLVREHMADENRLDFDAVLRTFPHPHCEIMPTGQGFEARMFEFPGDRVLSS